MNVRLATHAVCLLMTLFTNMKWACAETPVQSNRQEQLRNQIEKSGAAKIMNNMCWELALASFSGEAGEHTFELPVDRWVYLQSNAELADGFQIELHLDQQPDPILIQSASGSAETMQYLKAGTHQLRFRSNSSATANVVVRAMPATQYAFYGGNYAHITPFGPYDWEFLEKYMNPEVNVMIDLGIVNPDPAIIDSWTRSGRLWLSHIKALFDIDLNKAGEGERLQRYWENHNSVLVTKNQGILIDEIGEHNSSYDLYREVGDRMNGGSMKGRTFHIYGYGTHMPETESGRAFGNWVIEHGGTIACEWYLMDQPTTEKMEQDIQDELVPGMKKWTAAFPADRLVATLNTCNVPCENANRNPHIDFKVFLDMQMHALANDPAFFGLGGVQMYYSGYNDDEIIRWTAKLYRHYCIEGARERLTSDPLQLPHIANPDFAAGAAGWKLEPADKDSIAPKKFDGFGILQARWGGSPTDTFMWMRRNATKPNQVSQIIKDLTPGRLYALTMFSSDYGDLVKGESHNKWPTVRIDLENVEVLEGPKLTFTHPFPHSYGRTQGAFSPASQYWNNFHRIVFRATGSNAKLTISDWKNTEVPGGPPGQETAFNYVQVRPYLEP